MSEQELEFYECPKCDRNMKPSIETGILQITEYPHKTVKNVGLHDLLVCRYCEINVKVSLLREKKNPHEFLKTFKDIPAKCEISEEETEKIRLRKDHEENFKKYKHSPVPNKCPYCKSEDIVADCSEHGWICITCDEYFEWHNFRIIFHGDVELEAENKDMASEKAYYYLKKGNCDIEAEVDWM